ncbi:ABC1 kinase family protein [Hoyosella altamirensis]|uniref:Putative unusual protein kinase regulating ubiquinone biosynthesis (AarF/ABC1/UbiB family) n=1 Tax=Hoyosella altamirensis TaxID=616997 RepID=A0A839RHZ9_9ACTN|nr:AarF/UbiB family protein [Hoyosella altamirensis]MBB3035691.1 putative unusual protein kinase regulating ubiquinone biosynthesis (AarF/ABC1/UbiB family) [Hoyosella altamirensis]
MTAIPRGRAARTAKLARLPLGYAGRAAAGLGRRIAGQSSEEVSAEMAARAAEQLFNVLGELKGGAMKLGQAMSVFEAAVPEHLSAPYREALTKLQRDAPPMRPQQVHRVLDQQLGTSWRDHVSEFDEIPAAAASIGQVHKARWADGREVAVKIQYPGADEALRSDLRQIGRLAPLFKPLAPGTDIRALVDELTARSVEELDYRLEADNQRTFAEAFADSPYIRIPKVVASAPKVIVTEWIEGLPLSRVIAGGSAVQRSHAAQMLTEFALSSPALTSMIHTDAHPGNFMILDDGRLGVIDFGAIVSLSGGFPPELTKMIALAVGEHYGELLDHMVEAGYLAAERSPETEDLAEFLHPLLEPLRAESFTFSREWMQRVAAQYSNWRGNEFRTARTFTMPAQYMMLHRVLISTVAVLCQLDAHVPFGQIVRQWVPEAVAD